jgi:hypothetical protein
VVRSQLRALDDVEVVLGRADRDDLAAGRATLGAHVDQPVAGLDDVEVVLDDEDGVAGFDEALSTPSRRRTSSKWRPVVGSSST